MKYKTRLLLLLLCVYGFVFCVFYLHYRVQWTFQEKTNLQERLPRQQKSHRDKVDTVSLDKAQFNKFGWLLVWLVGFIACQNFDS